MAEQWQSVSVLLAGCGSIGKRHARVLRGLGVEEIWVCDPNAEQLAGLVRESPEVKPVGSFEEGLRMRPAATFILTPPKLHIPMSLQALEAGSAVFCEKPLSDSAEGVAALAGVVVRLKQKYMVGLCFRYHAGVLQARQLLASGRIGRLVSVRSVFGEHMPDVRPDYRSLFTAKYSGALDCMHDLDLALWFAGQPVRAVHAICGTYSDIGIEAPDVVEILLDFSDRCMGSVHLDFFQRPRRRQLDLIGTAGLIMLEFASWDEYTLTVHSAADGVRTQTTVPTCRDDMFAAEDIPFLEAVAEDQPISCGIAEAVKSLEVVEAVQGQRVLQGGS